MDATADDRPNRIHWPPLLYLANLLAAWVLGWLLPIGPVPSAVRVAGGLLLAAGIAVALAGIMRFRAVGTTIDPTGRARRLATGGVYTLTRNPMYLGAVLAFAGLGL